MHTRRSTIPTRLFPISTGYTRNVLQVQLTYQLTVLGTGPGVQTLRWLCYHQLQFTDNSYYVQTRDAASRA